MPSSERYKPVIPEYVKYMKDDALFSAKDLMEMFGYKTAWSIHSLIDRGMLPNYDKDLPHIDNGPKGKRPIFFWKKSTIMNYIKETWGDL